MLEPTSIEHNEIKILIDATNAESYIEEKPPRHQMYKITNGHAIIKYAHYITHAMPTRGGRGRGIRIHYYNSTGEEATITMRISDLEAAIECIKKDVNYA